VAVPKSNVLSVVPNPCTPSEEQRNFSSSDVPCGIIVWWTKTIDEIPAGWALADGTLNGEDAGGSGFRVVDRFVKGTDSDGENGTVEDAEPLKGTGEHEHDLTSDSKIVYGLSSEELTRISIQLGGAHVHPAFASGGGHEHDDGKHEHKVELQPKKIIIASGGNHTHAITSSPTIVNHHTSGDVALAIDDHKPHIHHLAEGLMTQGGSASVPQFVTGEDDPPQSRIHTGKDIGLPHDPHEHTFETALDGAHTHSDTVSHTHDVNWVGGEGYDGEHYHDGGEHTHTFVAELAGAHVHVVTDPKHSHSVYGVPHQHEFEIADGKHTHDPGDPIKILLMPIEKLCI
jgi:hypothetical protein